MSQSQPRYFSAYSCSAWSALPVKMLYLSTERAWHGGEEQLRLLMNGLAAAGHSCQASARRDSVFARRMKATGASVYELSRSGRTPRALWRLRRHIRNTRPDVIHANDSHAVVLMRFATWGIRGIVRVASRRVLFPIHSTAKYVKGCDQVLCVSEAIRKVCLASGLPESKLAVVHDGVDPARMRTGDAERGRRSLMIDADAPLVLCVAQLAPYKGHCFLIDAWLTVSEAIPSAVLVLAGEGKLRDELETQARDLGVSHSIRFLGYREDIPDLVAACDVSVLASPEEGLGSTVLDAMFAGRAVVGADAGGIPEMLRDCQGRECGWLVPPRDPQALAAAMLEALCSPEERNRRAALAHEWAMREFHADRMIERTLACYENLLALR